MWKCCYEGTTSAQILKRFAAASVGYFSGYFYLFYPLSYHTLLSSSAPFGYVLPFINLYCRQVFTFASFIHIQ